MEDIDKTVTVGENTSTSSGKADEFFLSKVSDPVADLQRTISETKEDFTKYQTEYKRDFERHEVKLKEVNQIMMSVVLVLLVMVAGMIISLLIAIWQSSQSNKSSNERFNYEQTRFYQYP